MTKHSDTQTFGPYGPNQLPATVAVQANGGSLTIVFLMDDDTEIAIEDGVISADGTVRLDVANGRYKATPAGGCEYEWRT